MADASLLVLMNLRLGAMSMVLFLRIMAAKEKEIELIIEIVVAATSTKYLIAIKQ